MWFKCLSSSAVVPGGGLPSLDAPRREIDQLAGQLVGTFGCDRISALEAAKAAFKIGAGVEVAANLLFEPEEISRIELSRDPPVEGAIPAQRLVITLRTPVPTSQ